MGKLCPHITPNKRLKMASLKTIITVSVLKKIPQDILLRKLSHIRDELVALNILSEDNAIKHQPLAHYLHEHCPQDLENFICSFALIAKPELFDIISMRLSLLGIETSPMDELETIAAKLAEKSTQACNVIAARKMAEESHTYSHYIPTESHSARGLTDEEISYLKEKIFSPYFDKKGRSKYIDIYPHITDKFVFYCISHGSPKTREHSVGEQNELSVQTFRPELVDIVRINLSNAEISVFTKKNSSRELREFYVESFGRIILPYSKFVENKKFDLAVLSDPSIFTVSADFRHLIESVLPFQFSYYTKDGCKITASKIVSEQYMDCIEKGYAFCSMIFNVVFRDNPNKKYKVSIHSESRSEFPIGVKEEIIDDFFKSKGLIKDSHREIAFELAATAEALPA